MRVLYLLFLNYLAKIVWYLPVTDRIKKMFANPTEAELLCWHVTKR